MQAETLQLKVHKRGADKESGCVTSVETAGFELPNTHPQDRRILDDIRTHSTPIERSR